MLSKSYLVLGLILLVVIMLVGCSGSAPLPKGCPPDCAGKSFYQAKLPKVNFRGANLQGADLGAADLRGADLSNADLTGGNVSRADLTGANLKGANLTNVDMKWTILRGADLTGATLKGAILSFAPYDQATKWPEGFNPKEVGAVLAPAK